MIGDQAINIRIDNTKLKVVKSVMYLVVIINNKCKLNGHLDYICKKRQRKMDY